MGHASSQAAQGFHLLGLQKLGFQFALFGAIQLHAEDALFVADADQRCKIKADMPAAF